LLRHVMSTHPARLEWLAASGTLSASDDCAVSDTTGPLERPKINKMPNSGVQDVEDLANRTIAFADVHDICETLGKPVTEDHGADFTGVKWFHARQHRRRRPDPRHRGWCAPATAAPTTPPAFGPAPDLRRLQRVPGGLEQSGTIRQRIDVTLMIAPQVSSS
jgi:hypothetical protein